MVLALSEVYAEGAPSYSTRGDTNESFECRSCSPRVRSLGHWRSIPIEYRSDRVLRDRQFLMTMVPKMECKSGDADVAQKTAEASIADKVEDPVKQ